jgi:hypothetical protein
MRINEITATNVPPVKSFFVAGLSDVVVLAGANGVGKTMEGSGVRLAYCDSRKTKGTLITIFKNTFKMEK